METAIERRRRLKKVDRLDELKSAVTHLFRIERQAMEQAAQLTGLWHDTLPDLVSNARRLEQLTSGVQLFSKDVKTLAERYQSAMSVLVLFAEKLDETTGDITSSVQALMQAEMEPDEILAKIEANVQQIIGLTLGLATLDIERQTNPQYVRRVITQALPLTLEQALDDMTPFQLKYLADMILPRLDESSFAQFPAAIEAAETDGR